MDRFHLKLMEKILRYKEEQGEDPSLFQSEIATIDGRKVSKEDYTYLYQSNLVEGGTDSVQLTDAGIDKVQDYLLTKELQSNRETNERLIEQEKRSSATETLFTITLIGFAFFQLMAIFSRSGFDKAEKIAIVGTGLTLLLVVTLAILIGEENLVWAGEEVEDKIRERLKKIFLR